MENLTLTVEAKEGAQIQDKEYRLREFNYDNFKKSLLLPDSIDIDKIEANFNSGILEIVLNKKNDTVSQKEKKINIH